jgi:hypothetical protein
LLTATRYSAYYSPFLLKKPLVQAYIRTEDTNSFISILRQIHDSVDRPQAFDDDTPATVPDCAEIIGQFVIDVVATSKQINVAKIEAILQVIFAKLMPI